MAKYYITTPIYYVNAKPHIGSAYPTLAADVVARWQRQQGNDVWFLTGTAEHGTKMATSAAKADKSPQEFVAEMSGYFQQAWQALNISHDDFIRTTEDRHERAVILFFKKLKESGKIYEGEYEGLYCVGHEAFLQLSELTAEGLCPDHGTAPQPIKEKNWFFKLSDYAPILREKIESGELVIEPVARRHEVLSFIDQGLSDISISRQNVDWAIRLPWDDSQTIYVWLDELFNYCSAIGYGVDNARFKKYWPADLHYVGKDLIKFHCIIWPALLLAIGEALPKKVFAHGFFTVDGRKMSKSLGNVIDPVELVEQYGRDAVRYLLLRDIPFGQDGDFSRQRWHDRYNADLANGLGNLVSRSLNMMEQYTFTPTPSASPATPPQAVGENSVSQHLSALALDKALQAIWQEITRADELIEKTKPWQLAKAGQTKDLQEVLASLYKTLATLSEQLVPFMPETAEKLKALLAARPLKKPAEPLFARLPAAV